MDSTDVTQGCQMGYRDSFFIIMGMDVFDGGINQGGIAVRNAVFLLHVVNDVVKVGLYLGDKSGFLFRPNPLAAFESFYIGIWVFYLNAKGSKTTSSGI